jgi:hypothetical protein
MFDFVDMAAFVSTDEANEALSIAVRLGRARILVRKNQLHIAKSRTYHPLTMFFLDFR